MKVFIASSRPIGQKCKTWAKENLLVNWEISDDIDHCDVFISVLYNQLVTKNYLTGRLAYNFHAGLLPKYRGSGSYAWALINKENLTGVTLHQIDAGIDTGPIIQKSYFKIDKTDTAESLLIKAEEKIFILFKENFHSLLLGKLVTTPQDEVKACTYYRKDLEEAKDLTRYIRALTFEGKENAYYYNNKGDKIYLNYYAETTSK